jgi:RND family efflux transporter MFP subunit
MTSSDNERNERENNEGQSPITCRTGLNILKSLTAVSLIAALAFFTRSYLGEGAKPNTASAATETAAPQAPPAPSVVVATVKNGDLAVGREYIGRVEPIQTVLLRPQVPGIIEAVHFKDGSIVREGDPLFSIDRVLYQATVALRRADLAKAEAGLSRASKYNERLKAADKRSVSETDLDMAANDVLQNRASIEQSKAALKLAQIDLDYTNISAPITGRISRTEATKGNYVTPAGAPLATLVQIDPIRVSFAMPDRDYLEQMDEFRSSGASVFDVTLRLANGAEYPFMGERDFEDISMDEKTGTIMMYLRFRNEDGVLVPGSMVRVATKPKKNHVAPIIAQEAVMTDAEGDYVYVVDENNVAHRRTIELGAEIGVAQEVKRGLSSGETIVVRGIQSVTPEMPVKPSFMRDEGAEKTPAERAMESGYDLPTVVSPGEESAGGTN